MYIGITFITGSNHSPPTTLDYGDSREGVVGRGGTWLRSPGIGDVAHGGVWCRAKTDENGEQARGQQLGSIVTIGVNQ